MNLQQLESTMSGFVQQAARITGDPNFAMKIQAQPPPMLAMLTMTWKPGGDPHRPWCSMVRCFERAGDAAGLEQLEGLLVVTLAELEKTTSKPTIH